MPDIEDELMNAARERAAARLAESPQSFVHNYALLAEFFRRHTELDSAGLGPELTRLRNALGLTPPQAPTIRGRFVALIGRVLSPLLWRLLRGIAISNPFEAVYEMLLREFEWRLDDESRMREELAAIKIRLEALEASHKVWRQPD